MSAESEQPNDGEQLFGDDAVEQIRTELGKIGTSGRHRVLEQFAMAALGSVPWVGGFLAAAASLKTNDGSLRANTLQTQWLEEHQSKIEALLETLDSIGRRFVALGDEVEERAVSVEYLSLVRQAFRAWDRAETEEKRKYLANLLVNAAGTRVASDDVVRMFIDWLDEHHEFHFAVIREIYRSPGISRYAMWQEIYGEFPREDSAEADLFRRLIRDLSTEGLIRQKRATTAGGQFLRDSRSKPKRPAPETVETSFERTKPYVLTALGKQFVHYAMNEVVTRIEEPAPF